MSAYHYYVVIHTAAFAIVTQSMAMLVTFDILHLSLSLHAMRVFIYTVSIFIFYYAAWASYNLTGDKGYRGACPAHCKFKSYSATWAGIIILGAPVYLFIIADLCGRLNKRHKKINGAKYTEIYRSLKKKVRIIRKSQDGGANFIA